MLDTGEWGLPILLDGRPDFQKPPAFYWVVARSGGLREAATAAGPVRRWAPAALAGLACVLLVYLLLRADGRPTAAMIAALGLATANHFTGISRASRIDVPLACTVAVSLLAFYRGCVASVDRGHLGRSSRRRW